MMSTKPRSLEAGAPAAAPTTAGVLDAGAIRSHVELLLASPHFRNSKRCQSLLRYVVDAYLEGELEKIKERTIGAEVFGRDPGYDTNQDSVVRTTAAEVRKRLAQYYLENGLDQEIRVVLAQGAYVPEFHVAPPQAPAAPAPAEAAPKAAWRRVRSPWFLTALGAITLTGVGIFSLVPLQRSELDIFWQPLVDDPAQAVISVGQPRRVYIFEGPRVDDLNFKMVGSASSPAPPDSVRQNTTISLSELRSAGERYLAVGNSLAMVRVAELMGRKGKSFQVFGSRQTSYTELRGRPAVLVGQFDNEWTASLTGGLRYYLDRNSERHSYEVRDRLDHDRVIASAPRDAGRPDEYIIITRAFNPTTEKLVIAIAGMTFNGTIAGGDFLTTPAYMRQAFKNAPAGWKRKNVQVVLETTMVTGDVGPPKVVATYFW